MPEAITNFFVTGCVQQQLLIRLPSSFLVVQHVLEGERDASSFVKTTGEIWLWDLLSFSVCLLFFTKEEIIISHTGFTFTCKMNISNPVFMAIKGHLFHKLKQVIIVILTSVSSLITVCKIMLNQQAKRADIQMMTH